MLERRRLLATTLAGLALASVTPASAQWGGYGEMGHGFGYSGYGYGNCGFGDCGGGNAAPLVDEAIDRLTAGTSVAGDVSQNQNANGVAPQPSSSNSRKAQTCYRREWDASEGWVNVAGPCR